MKNLNKKGFTIVELVIVIAVIGVLAGVLIPTFSGVVNSANQSAALQTARGCISNALSMSSTAALPGTNDIGAYQTMFFVDQFGNDGQVEYAFGYTGNELESVVLSNLAYDKNAKGGLTFNSVMLQSSALEYKGTKQGDDFKSVTNDTLYLTTGTYQLSLAASKLLESAVSKGKLENTFDTHYSVTYANNSYTILYDDNGTTDNEDDDITYKLYINSDFPSKVVVLTTLA